MCEHVPSGDRVRKEHTVQVYIDIFLPLGIGHLVRRRVDAYACIGVAEVKSAKPIDDFIHHHLHLILIRDITFDCDDFTSGGFCDLCSCFLGFTEIQIYDRDVGACFSECERRAFTDSSGRPCNESLFPVQSHFFNDSHVYSPLIVVCLFNLLQ